MKHLTRKLIMVFVTMVLGCASAFAQQVKGTVVDGSGYPVIGAAVIVEGTSIGTTVDLDGAFAFNQAVPSDAILVVSSIGYKTARIPVGGGNLNIVLEEDTEMLEETVVIGYGVQKKSVVTAAISSITSDDLKSQSNTRVDNLLQGMTSGVTVTTSSGAPDAGSQVRIRGVGTIHNSDPLYIVDGMPVGGIDYLNPADIERIEVLKDAASGAVYGARAANGVILVTTRQGKAGKTSVTYDFSYGWQNPWRKPQVLDATEYAIMMNEGAVNAGDAPRYADPYAFGKGTDWVEAIFNDNAPVMKHDININGGNDRVQYSTSAGFLSREGTIGGNYGRSNYDRFTLRQALNATLFDNSEDRNWLNKATIQTSASYAHINSTGISNNSEFGSPLGSALGMSPIEPIFADDATVEGYKTQFAEGFPYLIKNSEGRYYTVVDGTIYNEQNNPLAMLEQPGTKYFTDKFVANGNIELQIWDGLKFRTQVGIDMAYWGNHGYSAPYFLSSKNYDYDKITETTTYDKDGNPTVVSKTDYGSGASQELNRSLSWQVENILSYDKTFGENSISVILGQSALSQSGMNVGASADGVKYLYDEYMISVNNTYGKREDGHRNGWGSWNSIPYRLASYFGRVSYNYGERYMAEVTVRRDASSRFGDNNKWGTFPSASIGWNIKNESFLKDVSWLSGLKLRASWGINGNDNIGNFTYAVYMNSGNNYVFGSGANGTENITLGSKPSGLANPDVKWEQTAQTDIGVDAAFFGNRLTFVADWYQKNTTGMLLSLPVPGYTGESSPTGNLGDMVNSGVELDLGYRNTHGDFSWHVSANATYNKNSLTYLGDESTYLTVSTHKLGTLSRGVVGLPFPYYYGYKTDGIFQTPEEVAAYVNEKGELMQPLATPGDVRFVDLNGDGVIGDDDRTMIGKGMPDWTFGLNLGFEWKGLDFNMLLQGQAGAQAFNVTRRTDLYYINLPRTILQRWTGAGSSDKYPKFEFSSANENYRVSDLWVEDASFLRARNVQIGYTLPQNITKKAFIQRLRIYAQAENLFTLTKYTGCDPEVSGGGSYGTEAGIDRGVYPQNRTFTVGVNLSF